MTTGKEELWSLAASFLKQLEDSGEEFVFSKEKPLQAVQVESPGLIQASAESSETLKEFARRISTCTRCRLHQSRTNFVFGAGEYPPYYVKLRPYPVVFLDPY